MNQLYVLLEMVRLLFQHDVSVISRLDSINVQHWSHVGMLNFRRISFEYCCIWYIFWGILIPMSMLLRLMFRWNAYLKYTDSNLYIEKCTWYFNSVIVYWNTSYWCTLIIYNISDWIIVVEMSLFLNSHSCQQSNVFIHYLSQTSFRWVGHSYFGIMGSESFCHKKVMHISNCRVLCRTVFKIAASAGWLLFICDVV